MTSEPDLAALADRFMELRCARSDELHAGGMNRATASGQAEAEIRAEHPDLAEAADLEQAEVNRCMAEHPAIVRNWKSRYRLEREAAALEARWPTPRVAGRSAPHAPVSGRLIARAPRRTGRAPRRRAVARGAASSADDGPGGEPPPLPAARVAALRGAQ